MTPEFVRDGKLTAASKELVAHMQDEYDSMMRDPDKADPSQIIDDARRNYHTLVHRNKTMKPEEFLVKYPLESAKLWDHFMSALPDDDPRKAQKSADDAEAKDRSSDAKAAAAAKQRAAQAAQMSGESVPPLAYSDGRLSSDGRDMVLYFEYKKRNGGLPLTDATNAYERNTMPLHLFMQTRYAADLWQMYMSAEESERTAAIEAARLAFTVDWRKVNTPQDLLNEQARVSDNLSGVVVIAKSAADATTPLDLDTARRKLAEAETPEQLQRALIELHEARLR